MFMVTAIPPNGSAWTEAYESEADIKQMESEVAAGTVLWIVDTDKPDTPPVYRKIEGPKADKQPDGEVLLIAMRSQHGFQVMTDSRLALLVNSEDALTRSTFLGAEYITWDEMGEFIIKHGRSCRAYSSFIR